MAEVDVFCSSFLNSIIRPLILCGMCPKFTPLLCFHSEIGLTIHLIVQSIRFSIIINLVWVTFVSTYLIFLLRTHALEQCRRFNGLYSEKFCWRNSWSKRYVVMSRVSVLDTFVHDFRTWLNTKVTPNFWWNVNNFGGNKRVLLDLW